MERVILDVDTGIDDALAIIYAIKSKEIHLEGITTGFGNVTNEQATSNTLRVIELAEPSYSIPVAMGAEKPLYRPKRPTVAHVHGQNGIGDYTLPEPKQKALDEHAADFIVRKINENVNELTLLFVGRLTNLALALKKDPSIVGKVKGLVLMGGALQTYGNVTGWAEANIYGDPDAAKEVFESGLSITMVGLDVTRKADFREEHLNRLMDKMSPEKEALSSFIKHIVTFGFEASEKMEEGRQRLLHDPLAVGVVINPTFVQTENYHVYVENEGKYTTGATIADYRKPQTDTNASVCLGLKREEFINHFINTISS
ncbi:nucleoside hydrolase [Bacillus sp. B15-48]|uniref:nucleoside hydrolase n=1 Tax=Bacillus sp. B15-48 TaxID=1548601 RepID=UPI00193F0F71|nr:nucleoside hydrolase [Bacillus sp. B15-48]MBM4761240.1 nucleoside hydrolase [Bacillus sp. B15-48]